MSEWGQQMVAVAVMVVIVVGVGVAWVTRGSGAEPEPVATAVMTPGPEPTTAPEPTATESEVEVEPSETEGAEPTPSPSPSVSAVPEGQTVLFRGGPAEGPWRTIGSVAEITHPDAAPGSTFGYANFWADPAEENQPDWLWDQITAEVAAEAVQLGEPVTRPAFGGAELSEAFNAFGGVEDIYPSQRVYTALWSATYQHEDDTSATTAHWGYVISFEGEILATFGPFLVGESDVEDALARGEVAVEWLRRSASEEGYSCEVC